MIMSEIKKSRSMLNNEKTAAADINRELEILALVRTRFASERTIMSWMRTSISMYTFGFSISKFFVYLEGQQEGTQFSDGPYKLGVALICVGLLVLVPAIVQHIRRLRKAKELGMPTISISRLSPAVGVATALFVIGIVTLFTLV
jgi:putative membrane protein